MTVVVIAGMQPLSDDLSGAADVVQQLRPGQARDEALRLLGGWFLQFLKPPISGCLGRTAAG